MNSFTTPVLNGATRQKRATMKEIKPLTAFMPRHFQRWIGFVQRLPVLLMTVFTVAVLLDNQAPIGTLTYLQRFGIGTLEFGSACLVSTIYLLAASRKVTWQSGIHFALGTLPVSFYAIINIFRAGTGTIPWTAVVIYLFAYIALCALYWLAVALAEWANNLAHAESKTT